MILSYDYSYKFSDFLRPSYLSFFYEHFYHNNELMLRLAMNKNELTSCGIYLQEDFVCETGIEFMLKYSSLIKLAGRTMVIKTGASHVRGN